MSLTNSQSLPHGEIMIVDENTSDLRYLSDILAKAGYRVRPAVDGKLALRSVRAKQPELILMDIKMSGMSGIELCRRIKADPETHNFPIIFISAFGDSDLKVNALEAGGIDYITKPYEPTEVLARISTHLNMHRLQRKLALNTDELIAEIVERKKAEKKLESHRENLEALVEERANALNKSEARFKAMFSNMSSGVAVFEVINDAEDFVFIDYNPAAERIDNFSREKLLGKTINEMFPGVYDHGLLEVQKRVWRTGIAEHFPATMCQDDRIQRWRESFVYKLPSGEIVVIFTDVTERMQAEKERDRSRKFMQSIIDGVPDALMVINIDYTIALANRAVCQSHEKVPVVPGLKCHQISHASESLCDSETHPCPLKIVVETKAPVRLEHIHCDAKGNDINVELIAAPIFDDKGEVVQIIELSRDISIRNLAEKALRESESRFKGMFDNMSSGMAVYKAINDGEDFVFIDFNPAAERIENIAREAVIGKAVSEVFPGVETFGLPAVFRRVWQTGIGEHFPITMYHDGRINGWRDNFVYKLSSGEIVAIYDDVTERKRAEVALRNSEEKNRELIENLPQRIFHKDINLVYVSCNKHYADDMGFKQEDIKGKTDYDFYPKEFAEKYRSDDKRIIAMGQTIEIEESYIKDGENFFVQTVKTPLRDNKGNVTGILGIFWDITERKQAEKKHEKLESQLRQSQKMEAVGQLAGGVAHDFNNMLAVILGNTEMALDKVESSSPLHTDLSEIKKASEHSADLTRQLLAFARKQTISPKILNLNTIVEGMLKMLRRLIGEDIDLVWKPEPKIWSIEMDPSQIDQLLANMCVNSRDAIDGVGKVTIETKNSIFDEDYCAEHIDFIPGEYVSLTVSDNGSGMDKETLAQVFDPFFTTKKEHEGTGLGLAMIYGIVRQNKGFINVYSEAEHGSTFNIYLPRNNDKAENISAKSSSLEIVYGTETVLLVEDEASILAFGTRMLCKLGYTVLAAGTPGEAIEQAKKYRGDIQLLISDVIMPDMNGHDLSKHLQALYPDIKLLFMSGYTANVIAHHNVLDDNVNFIQKPFSMQNLSVKIRETFEKN